MLRRLLIVCAAALSFGALAPATQAGWSPVGSGVLNVDASKTANSPSIAIIGGVPYVAWREDPGSGAGQVHVARWTGSNWQRSAAC
jgi:hypothetical protein